jgi:hypothetical protein
MSNFSNSEDSMFYWAIVAFGGLSIFLFFFNCLQYVLILLTINTVLPENFYYLLKLFCSLVLTNIPDYENEMNP